ncbi:hypothetical protein FBU30_003155 [Linnemannia zychae]|nr:hypothetical protein FBU30_003155 [Linnemannia zychae]
MTPMLTVDARLESFTQKTRSWPHPDNFRATPSSLAEAGFYWKPFSTSPDNVVCFLCGKSLDGWTPDDDPFEEHLTHSRNCSWAIVKSIYPVEDGLPFRWDDEDNLPKGERMTKARLQTFGKWWPHEKTKGWFGTAKRMANAGFIYAPTDDSNDNVQCPYCETALDGWEIQDDPVHEHQRRRPNCPFFATRASAPTKASAAKATKQKRKATESSVEDGQSVTDESSSRSKEGKQGSKKTTKNNRTRISSSEPKSSRSSKVTDISFSSRVVDFDLPESSETASKSESKRSSTISTKEASSRTSSIKVKTEEEEQSTSSILTLKSTKNIRGSKSTSKIDSTNFKLAITSERLSQLGRKRHRSGDLESKNAPLPGDVRFTYLSKSNKKQDTVVKKKRRLGIDEQQKSDQESNNNIINTESENQDELPDDNGGSIPLESSSHETDATIINREELLPSEEAPVQPEKPKRGRRKQIKIEDGGDSSTISKKTKRKPVSTKATKRVARLTSTSSAKKRATKTLIEIFEQESIGTTMDQEIFGETQEIESEHNKQGSESNQHAVVKVFVSEPMPTESTLHDNQNIPPSTTSSIDPISPRTPTRVQDSSFSTHQNITAIDLASTPVRKQAVTMEDIEDANVVIVDPSTPIRRVASRTDIEGWEDEDRRDSNHSESFLSPSQWHLDSSLMTSTPKIRRTPTKPLHGVSSRQRIKDVIGNAHINLSLRTSQSDKLNRSLQMASSSPRKAGKSQQLPPEIKQSMLIDRLESLMHENANSEVMVVAEHALKEEVKQFRRSQNKERRQAAEAAEAAAAASILNNSSITGGTEANILFEGPLGLHESDGTEDDGTDINLMRTPVRKTARVLFESTTPMSPNKTPSTLPVSRVITAIGAASRRNNTAAAKSPFVRTPVKKSNTDVLRLEDLEVDMNYIGNRAAANIVTSSLEPQQHFLQEDINSDTDQTKVTGLNKAQMHSLSKTTIEYERWSLGTGSYLQKDQSHQPLQALKHQQQQLYRGDIKSKRLHENPEEHRRREKLLEEADLSESQLKMTVEEFHRACVAEQVLALEVAAEAWVQRFEEESNRVRRALMDEDMSG